MAKKDIDGTNLALGPEVVVQGWKREEEGCLENRYCTGQCPQRKGPFLTLKFTELDGLGSGLPG